ncbi:hypothetical protein [Massilia sp. PWRC2]|uniref:hypothetical protein n=1 Tax=Massilia sp. PWRC2 TaxID=2804626 RepID=UPI003CF40515
MSWSPLIAVSVLLAGAAVHAQPLPTGIKTALQNERIGLLDAGRLKLTNGKCGDCASSPQSLWYFQNEFIAAPLRGTSTAGVTAGLDRRVDIREWAATPAAQQLAYPVVTWIGAPQLIDSARIDGHGTSVTPAAGAPMALTVVPKLSTNRSYVTAATMAFFSERPVRMRGTTSERDGKPVFVARTIWPADYALDGSRLALAPLGNSRALSAFVQQRASASDGKLNARLLWERSPGAARVLAGKPVLGLVLNGAQGDDDESIGGHFAVATGRFGSKGEWADWAVNNFYNLDSVSEKGIIAATVPMDNYLMDLNSGQQYYRPSTMLVAVLNKERTAVAYQGGVQRSMNHFYRHELMYGAAASNCAGLSIDVFEALGWNVPQRGPTSPVKAIGAYAYVAAKEVSLTKGRGIYDYLTEETTRLLPAVAFDALGLDLLQLVGAMPATPRTLSPFEQQLKDDVEAIIVVNMAQLPSSRVTGAAPAYSFDDYMSRVPPDQDKWQVVPVPPRPFPAALRDPTIIAPVAPSLVPLPVATLGIASLCGGGALWRRRKKKVAARA